MQVFKVSEGTNYPDFTLNEREKTLTIEGVRIDLEAAVKDGCQNVLYITRSCCGTCVLGLDGKAGYVADIEIPARQYRQETTGEGDQQKVEDIPLPLDLDTVVLKLWPCGAEENNEMEA